MGDKYAKGDNAFGECARSGRKMPLRELVPDGRFPNLLVDPAWWEDKHPQETLPAMDDPMALFQPSPDRSDTEHGVFMDSIDGGDASTADSEFRNDHDGGSASSTAGDYLFQDLNGGPA